MQFATTAPKTYCYRAQKDDHKIEDCEFIKATAVKKSTSKELPFHNVIFTGKQQKYQHYDKAKLISDSNGIRTHKHLVSK